MSFSENQRQANKYLVEQTEQLEKQVKKALYAYYFDIANTNVIDTMFEKNRQKCL